MSGLSQSFSVDSIFQLRRCDPLITHLSDGPSSILIVDDRSDDRRYLATLFGYQGYVVYEAADALQAGIWGRAAALDARLRDGDRVELTRGLLVDPKEARRQRYRRDGVRGKRVKR